MTKYLKPKNYIIFLINRIYILLLPLIKKWEKKYYKKYANVPLKHQPVFIIGAPRTGSTILYQILTNQLDVLYIDNLICRFDKSLFFGFWLSDKLFKQTAHNCFKSDQGDTTKCGSHAPSECGSFWYRWLPKDRHFIDYDDINDKMIKEIRKEIAAVINYFDKPIMFKNLNAGQRLRLLQKCFPEAKFIFIKREPIYTAQSILKVKRKLVLNDNDFWSVMPKNVEQLSKLNGFEQIVKQIFYLEKQIEQDTKLFKDKNIMRINYTDLCQNFEDVVKQCKVFVKADKREDYKKAEIKLSEKITLDENEIDRLKKEIAKLDWGKS
jgi:LPS sulfotransferase NodH